MRRWSTFFAAIAAYLAGPGVSLAFPVGATVFATCAPPFVPPWARSGEGVASFSAGPAEVRLGHLPMVLRAAMPQPFRGDVCGKFGHEFHRPAGPQVLKQLGPRFQPDRGDDPLQAGS